MTAAILTHNTLVVAAGVAAVGFAAGMVGGLGLLRKRPLVADAAAHATLLGVAGGFLATGRRDLPTLLAGALVTAVAALGTLVLVRRFTRTRDDAATAITIGVGFGAGIALLSGITARGIPGAAGLGQFLLGHTAALASRDALLLAAVSAVTVGVVWLGFKEAMLVAFDAEFAAATGWPVAAIDLAVVTLVAVMVVVGLPAAGAVLVTGLVVIPPVAARQWTDRGSTLLLLAGLFGLAAAGAGVIVGAAAPRIAAAVGLQTPTGLATGPLVVLAAAAIAAVSFVAAPDRGWIVRGLRAAEERRRWTAGLILDACLRAAGDGAGRSFSAAAVRAATGGGRRAVARGWESLVREGIVAPESAADTWRLTETGRAVAAERRARIRGWEAAFDAAPAAAREAFSLELREPPR